MHACCVINLYTSRGLKILHKKICTQEALSSEELNSGLGSKNYFSFLASLLISIPPSSAKEMNSFFFFLIKPHALSYCFMGWSRKRTPYSHTYQWDGETPQKGMCTRCSEREEEHQAGGERTVTAPDIPHYLRGFPEPPVTTCPAHIRNDSWIRLFI